MNVEEAGRLAIDQEPSTGTIHLDLDGDIRGQNDRTCSEGAWPGGNEQDRPDRRRQDRHTGHSGGPPGRPRSGRKNQCVAAVDPGLRASNANTNVHRRARPDRGEQHVVGGEPLSNVAAASRDGHAYHHPLLNLQPGRKRRFEHRPYVFETCGPEEAASFGTHADNGNSTVDTTSRTCDITVVAEHENEIHVAGNARGVIAICPTGGCCRRHPVHERSAERSNDFVDDGAVHNRDRG